MKHTIPSTVWETKRAQIAKLYKDEEWPLKQVIKQVRSPDFNPSETQLRSKLKKWRVTKPSRQVRKLPKSNRQLKSPSHPRPPPAQIDVDEDGWSDKASSGSPTAQLESPGKEKGKPSAEEEPATPEDSLPATTRVSKPSLDAWIPPALSESNNNRRYSFPYDPVPPAGWPIQLDTSQWYDSLSTGPGTAGQTNQASTETIYPSPALSQSSGLTCANQGVQSVAVSPHQQTMYSTSLPQSSSSSCSSSASAILQDNTAEYSYDYLKNWTPWQILPVEDFSTPADVYPYSTYPAVDLNVNLDMYPGQKELDKTGAVGLAVPGTGIY